MLCGINDQGKYMLNSLVMANSIHDVIDDTESKLEEVEYNFGSAIRSLILEVCDDKSLDALTIRPRRVQLLQNVKPFF